MSIYIFTRLRSIITWMLLLAVCSALLPVQRASADLTFPLSKAETDRVFIDWYYKHHGGVDKNKALFVEQTIAANLIEEAPQLSATEMTKRLDELDAHYYQLLGPRGADPAYRASLPQRTVAQAMFTAALQTPGFKDDAVQVHHALTRLGEDYRIVEFSGLSASERAAWESFMDDQVLGNAIGALFSDAIDKAPARAKQDKEFAYAWNEHFTLTGGIPVEELEAERILKENAAAIPQPIRAAVRPDGSMQVSLSDLEQLAKNQFGQINASIDDIQGTLVTLSKQQGQLVDFMKDQQKRQQAQALAEAKAKEHQLKLQAASSAISIISTIVGLKYPERGKQIAVVGQSLISVGESLNGWMQATAGLSALAKLGSLSTVVMTGNLLGAVMNIVSLFGPQQPAPEQIILEEIGKLRQQVNELRTEMHTRFDQIDKELNSIYTSMNARFDQIDVKLGRITGSLQEIQDSLLALGMTLNRMERNNTEYFDTLGRRPLREAINGAIGYRERTGLDMPYQPDFVGYENTFQTWGTINAFDALSAGPSQRDYSDGQVLAELSAAPLDANLNYLNGWLQAHGMQPFATKRLASPRDWAFASRAYAQLGQDWPAHLLRIDSQRQAALDAVGADLEQALQNISTMQTAAGPQGNAPLFTGVTAYYSAKLQGLDGALQASQAAFVQELQSSRNRTVPFDLYGGLDQALASPYQPDSFSTISCGPEGLPPTGLPTPRQLRNIVPAYNRFALADYLGTNPLTVCVDGSFGSLDPPCPGGPETCDRYGSPRVVILVRSDKIELARFYVDGQRSKFDPNIWNVVAPQWQTYWKPIFERYFVSRTTPDPLPPFATPQLETVSGALTSKLAELQRSYASRVPGELGRGGLQARVVELIGAKKLLESFVILGVPRAIDNDDFLRSLLFSKESLIDEQQITSFYTLPAASATQAISATDLLVNPRVKLMQTAQKRRDALGGVLSDYLGSISTESYREDNALVADARFDIRLARAFAGQNAPLPGQTRHVFLPLLQR